MDKFCRQTPRHNSFLQCPKNSRLAGGRMSVTIVFLPLKTLPAWCEGSNTIMLCNYRMLLETEIERKLALCFTVCATVCAFLSQFLAMTIYRRRDAVMETRRPTLSQQNDAVQRQQLVSHSFKSSQTVQNIQCTGCTKHTCTHAARICLINRKPALPLERRKAEENKTWQRP